jgi:serine/threonine protein kinase
MTKRLCVLAGPNQGASYELPDGAAFTIGRSQQHNDICLNDLRLSRVHCEIRMEGGQVTIADLDSDAGVLINGNRVAQHMVVKGDTIVIGDTQLRVQFVEDEVRPTAAEPSPAETLALDGMANLSGTTLGHFELGRILGKGHCGLVFEARDHKANRAVALKVFHPSFPTGEEEMQRFVKAIKTGLSLRHPHLVTLHGAGRNGGHVWMALELVEGESLTERIKRVAKEPEKDWREAYLAALQLGAAIDYAHQQQATHRNVTPRNILVYSADNYLLGDLVLARALEGSQARQISMRNKIRAELYYLAPEQTYAPAKVDARTDLYSLGACLYALLMGRPPFVGTTQGETIAKIRQDDPIKPRRLHPGIPAAFEKALLKLLAKKPEDRLQTGGQLVQVLQHVEAKVN